MILVLDNRDSFVFNLARCIHLLGVEVRVVPSHDTTVEGISRLAPRALVISPGPCTPAEAGCSVEAIRALRGHLPMLGVCLGHQAIGDCHGMVVRRNDVPVHGKTSPVLHDGRGVFAGLPNPFVATRYHSLVVDPATVGPDFEVSARTERGEVMGLRWKAPPGSAPMEGVQFHPESFLTVDGPALLGNFLAMRPAGPLTRTA